MGLANAKLTLSNPQKPGLQPVNVDALADTGAIHLCVPQHLATQLELTEIARREVVTADGATHLCAYVGPLQVSFENRTCFAGALVLGDSVLLGAVPMEDMDLVVTPSLRRVTVNPANPNIALSIAKGFRSHCPA